jgi:hypothetical protein
MLLLLSLGALLGIAALALNLAWLTSHQIQLRHACEAAALAGAAELLDPTPAVSDHETDQAAADRVAAATSRAREFFAPNSPAVLQTSGVDPDVLAGWVEDPSSPHAIFTRWTGVGSVNSLSVRGVRRRSYGQAVVLWFGGLFGMRNAEPAAAATATMDQRVYGFRPVKFVSVPMVPLLVFSAVQWPSCAAGAEDGLPDNYSIDPRTGEVIAEPDGISEITLRVPLAGGSLPSGQAGASWLTMGPGATDFNALARQVSQGLAASDLAAIGGQFAFGQGETLSIPAASAPAAGPAGALQDVLLGIRGQKRIWPIGSVMTQGGHPVCLVTGFVAGCVADCSLDGNCLTIVVQACTIQTCTALLRSGTPRNPWIGKLILNE